MKFTHILCRTLCIYGGQVPARACGGWGRWIGVGIGVFIGVCA